MSTPGKPTMSDAPQQDDGPHLVVFSWITHILGLPTQLKPDLYNQLTDKMCELIAAQSAIAYGAGRYVGLRDGSQKTVGACKALLDELLAELPELVPDNIGNSKDDFDWGKRTEQNAMLTNVRAIIEKKRKELS